MPETENQIFAISTIRCILLNHLFYNHPNFHAIEYLQPWILFTQKNLIKKEFGD